MAEQFMFFDSIAGDREYYAADFTDYFADIISSGVSAAGDNLTTTAASESMAVEVTAGRAWIKGKFYRNTATKTLAISNGGANPRIDRVVVRLDYLNRSIGLAVIEGTAAASPVAPDIVRDTTYWDLCIAEVAVAASAISLSTETDITDTRTDDDVCGIVYCLIEHVSAGDFLQASEAAFNNWLLELQTNLSGDVAGNLYDLITRRLPFTGGTMTGPLTLAGDPTEPLHAANKGYTDRLVSSLSDEVFGEKIRDIPDVPWSEVSSIAIDVSDVGDFSTYKKLIFKFEANHGDINGIYIPTLVFNSRYSGYKSSWWSQSGIQHDTDCIIGDRDVSNVGNLLGGAENITFYLEVGRYSSNAFISFFKIISPNRTNRDIFQGYSWFVYGDSIINTLSISRAGLGDIIKLENAELWGMRA